MPFVDRKRSRSAITECEVAARRASKSGLADTARTLSAIALFAFALSLLPGLGAIAPLVESDYCYQLLAADHLYDGLGPLSLQPIAPNQPWEWFHDWGFLTQWPVGYPAIICAIRWVLGGSSLEAARVLSIAACATALVGWFLWLGQCIPIGKTRRLVAVAGAATAVPVSFLVNPSTDLIVVAALPYLLRMVISIPESKGSESNRSTKHHLGRSALLGAACGALFWIRYASVFVPMAIGAYLLIEMLRKRVSARTVCCFALSGILPMLLLIALNLSFGSSQTASASLNLGTRASLSFTPAIIAQAWSNFTNFGYYAHRPMAQVILAAWPLGAIAVLFVLNRRKKRNLAIKSEKSGIVATSDSSGIVNDPFVLNAGVVAAGLSMLIGATAVFGAKYNYVGLERYYFPIRPLYFSLFVLPLLAVPSRAVRVVVATATVGALIWSVQVDGVRDYRRAASAQVIQSPYGQWVRSFGPDPTPLINWLKDHDHDGLVIVSNYHEYLALETGLATLPIPPDRKALDDWLNRIQVARGVSELEVLLVIDPDNRWRSYWIPEPGKIVRTFGLEKPIRQFTESEVIVYSYRQGRRIQATP